MVTTQLALLNLNVSDGTLPQPSLEEEAISPEQEQQASRIRARGRGPTNPERNLVTFNLKESDVKLRRAIFRKAKYLLLKDPDC